jgi:hypothetical protein
VSTREVKPTITGSTLWVAGGGSSAITTGGRVWLDRSTFIVRIQLVQDMQEYTAVSTHAYIEEHGQEARG